MVGTLTDVSNGIVMGYLYRMRDLDLDMQETVLLEVMRRHQIGNNLGGSARRMQYIIALCKEIMARPLLKEEQLMVDGVRTRFNHIEDVPTLDLCLLFWSITHNPIHRTQLQIAIYDPKSPVKIPAYLLLLNYPGLIYPSFNSTSNSNSGL